jgi:hypothetical protein
MKPTTASNIALIGATLSWPLVWFGVVSQLGDYAPGTPSESIISNTRLSVGAIIAGLAFLFGSLWLSGYGFAVARVRSLLAASICLGLPIALVAFV